MKYFVTATPWPSKLPNGTEIVPCEPRLGVKHTKGVWFQRADGELLFDEVLEELDGKFRLFNNEYETKEI
jgi:hypothetical protein